MTRVIESNKMYIDDYYLSWAFPRMLPDYFSPVF